MAVRGVPSVGALKRPVLLSAAVVLAVGLSSCGSSHPAATSSTTSATSAAAGAPIPSGQPQQHPRRASIVVFSPARMGDLVISPHYTCHGAEVTPPLLWAGVPPHTAELGIFVRTILEGHVTTNWAMVGVNPSLQRIAAGTLPSGAIVGRNSFGKVGYSLCPPDGGLITMGVYAFPHALGLKRGFNPESLKPMLGSGEVPWGGVAMLGHAERPAKPQ
jgi:phosphatidylethanolamine-binding protein (PEBP) family uncharacterized protein